VEFLEIFLRALGEVAVFATVEHGAAIFALSHVDGGNEQEARAGAIHNVTDDLSPVSGIVDGFVHAPDQVRQAFIERHRDPPRFETVEYRGFNANLINAYGYLGA
jgi:hypothetical protein